ncbi:MAG: ATP-binding protein [Elusimicrobiota bacterium]
MIYAEMDKLITNDKNYMRGTFIKISEQGNILDISGGIEAFLGFETKELIGSGIKTIISNYDEIFNNHKEKYGSYETVYRHKSGLEKHALFTGIKQSNLQNNEIILAGVSYDVKKLSALRADFIYTNKLTAMGQLGASIAHDLKQPIAIVTSLAQLILMNMDKDGVQKSDIEKLYEISSKMCKMIDNLWYFAHKSKSGYKETSVNACIENALYIFENDLRLSDIDVEKNLGQAIPGVFADQSQLEQVFVNLIANAKDAIAETKGKIIITTALSDDGKNVEINIRDNGCGISQEHLPRIFDAFYTTKECGEGTGLGLAIVKQILKEQKGDIKVRTDQDKGATFVITLPIKKS